MSARFYTGRAYLARPGFAVQLFSSPNGGWVGNFNRFSWIWPKGWAGWGQPGRWSEIRWVSTVHASSRLCGAGSEYGSNLCVNRWSPARPSSPGRPVRRPLKGYFEPISPNWSPYRGFHGTFDRPLLAVAFAVGIWHRSAVAGDVKATIFKGCGCSSGVEHDLAKVGVEGSNPFARSSFSSSRTESDGSGPFGTTPR